MKKRLLVFVVIIPFVFISCRYSEMYNFLNPTDEITEITIVNLSFSDDGSLIETKIQEIEDINMFLTE